MSDEAEAKLSGWKSFLKGFFEGAVSPIPKAASFVLYLFFISAGADWPVVGACMVAVFCHMATLFACDDKVERIKKKNKLYDFNLRIFDERLDAQSAQIHEIIERMGRAHGKGRHNESRDS